MCICHSGTVSLVLRAVDILLCTSTLLQFLLGPTASSGMVLDGERWVLGKLGEVVMVPGFVFYLEMVAARIYCCTFIFGLCPEVQPQYIVITQAGMLRATESTLITWFPPSPIIHSELWAVLVVPISSLLSLLLSCYPDLSTLIFSMCVFFKSVCAFFREFFVEL